MERDQRRFNFCWSNNHREKGASAGGNASSTNSASGKRHTVKSGDSLWGLSMQYGISIQKIKQLNGLSGDTIYIGQTLKVG